MNIKSLFAALFAFFLSGAMIAQSPFWIDESIPQSLERNIFPSSFRSLQLDDRSMEDFLEALPSESEVSVLSSGAILSFPMPDGSFEDFRVVESSIMHPDLQSRFPEIRTFLGQGIDDRTATVRFDMTPRGFHAQIIKSTETIYIDPASFESTEYYIAYTKDAFYESTDKVFNELPPVIGEEFDIAPDEDESEVEKSWQQSPLNYDAQNAERASSGSQLREYRLALACTGEYATFHGGTVPLTLAAMVTSMNRVNGVYEREVAIRMNLVPNNDQIIFLNAATDPYTNNSGSTMLNQNQTTCDNVIGSANYDIGHVYSTGGGGIAQLNSPCGGGKARGVTGQPTPVGDPFDIDYVCHEMGHQFGGNHTQNNSCNRASSAAYEPGSASTIMGYAGICAPNLQSNSDDYFHNHSYNEILNFSVNGNGNTCASISATGNGVPTVDAGVGGFTIPNGTPFELTATGSDPDGDLLTYNWEEYDLGPATASGDNDLSNPSGNQPTFRSWPGTVSPTRVFPRIQDLVNNTTVVGEHLPTYGRNLRFRCTVRDNRAGGGGVNDDEILFAVDGTAGPFLVLSPNTAVNYPAGTLQTVTWDVSNTDQAPVSCSQVDIFLSTDGGFTYPITLATGVPNNGSASVLIPNNQTTQARVKVKASNSIFFDISNTNFTISAPVGNFDDDAAVTAVLSPSGNYCASSVPAEISISNLGVNTLTSATIEYSVDGGTASTFSWTGSLPTGASETVVLGTLSPGSGAHTFEATLLSPNGVTDEDPSNNTANSSFDLTSGEQVTFTFLTDCWGEEVSWTLQEENGGPVIDSEGTNTYADLATYTYEYCLSPGCYDLTINDSFGDGVAGSLYGSCGVDGDYNVTGSTSGVLVQMGAANYGSQIVENFCITATSVPGCTDPTACNYDPAATTDDGSCILPDGCTDPTACNYDPAATCDDGSCTLPDGCTDPIACNYDAAAVCDDGSCQLPDGCTDPAACNYNAGALCDDGSCILPDGCTDPAACNFDPAATCDDGSCVLPDGCTDPLACNYDPAAVCDDGSCQLPDGCTDPAACNYNAGALCDDGSCVFGSTWYQDNDNDSFGSSTTLVSCTQPAGYVAVTGDCDDNNPAAYPGAPSTQEGIDNDCNGTVDPDEESQCPGDFNNDLVVNIADLLFFLADFGCSTACSADLNDDGVVNTSDLVLFNTYYGNNCQ